MNGLTIVLLVGCWICAVAVDITDIDDYDPGSCDQTNALSVYSVNDRNDEKKLWICSDENGNYLWKPVDGDVTLGEFLHPGRNCSDILNHEADARDGFYWIIVGVNTKRRVWCDMKTDGGGYMLVARKHDAITWDIPSKDETADPKSTEKYWTSQLGDAPILDFRIQLSTSDSFDDTKAHWSFRLNNKRPLGELMITDRGCSVLEPGIGDIAYVKDLRTETIVSTTFECSVFGVLQSSGDLGWSMMNECLKNSCSGSGYFHFKGVAIAALDHTGVFSYSASGTSSGVGNDATASMGCVNQKCCGCYGPIGKTGNYCNSQCSTANGGNIIDAKDLYTWVWVRSSLPKRIWNRCMEYESQDENGQIQWYNLVGDSVIPKKGRCSNTGELRLNSGVIVVPNNTTAKKVPGIPGMLEYRQDKKKLYLRANKTWNLVAQEKEVEGKLMQLEESIDARLEKLKGKIQATDAEMIKNLSFAIPNYNAIVKDGMKMNFRQCTEYKWLTGYDRHYGYYDAQGYSKCDNHLSGWYRFGGGAGTKMYTGCMSNYYCNTYFPGYMSGSHPSVNDGIVTRTVHFCHSGNDYDSGSIRVINCADLYYVYELNGTPNCNYRYCSV